MKLIQISTFLAALLFTSCASINLDSNYSNTHITKKKIKARVTYWSNATCPYGNRVACSKKIRAKEGITVAAPPSIKFGTPVLIPGLRGVKGNNNFIVQDRGRDVTKARASKGKAPVIDVYVQADSKKDGLKKEKYLTTINPDYLMVEIIEPNLNKPPYQPFKF